MSHNVSIQRDLVEFGIRVCYKKAWLTPQWKKKRTSI